MGGERGQREAACGVGISLLAAPIGALFGVWGLRLALVADLGSQIIVSAMNYYISSVNHPYPLLRIALLTVLLRGVLLRGALELAVLHLQQLLPIHVLRTFSC